MSGAESPRILIAASGTGGHLVPAVLVAEALREESPTATIEFIGSGRPLEEKIIVEAGWRRHVVRTVGLKSRGIKGAVEYLLTLPSALLGVERLLRSFRPNVVVGVGGYVSFLPVTLAAIRGTPTWIHEAEMKPGMANAVLARYATRVSLAFENTPIPRPERAVYTGQPLRKEMVELTKEERIVEVPKRLLILGGSLGATALDRAAAALAPFFKSHELEVWHQCREENIAMLEGAYQEACVPVRIDAFIDTVEGYKWCDCILARSGASVVNEVGVANRPAVFVPFPHAQGDHQFHNAKVLAEAGKALIVREGDGFERRLQDSLKQLLNPQSYQRMRARPPNTRSLEAAKVIAAGILELA